MFDLKCLHIVVLGEVFFFLLGVLFIFLKYEITGAIVATISVIFFLLNCFLCGNIKKTHDLHNVSSVERNENYIESTNNDLVMENINSAPSSTNQPPYEVINQPMHVCEINGLYLSCLLPSYEETIKNNILPSYEEAIRTEQSNPTFDIYEGAIRTERSNV